MIDKYFKRGIISYLIPECLQVLVKSLRCNITVLTFLYNTVILEKMISKITSKMVSSMYLIDRKTDSCYKNSSWPLRIIIAIYSPVNFLSRYVPDKVYEFQKFLLPELVPSEFCKVNLFFGRTVRRTCLNSSKWWWYHICRNESNDFRWSIFVVNDFIII